MKKSETLKLLATIAAAYSRFDVTSARADIYHAGLADIEAPAVESAIVRLVRSSKWPPTIAEIREQVAEAKLSHLSAPELAWSEVLAAVRSVGSYGSPEWSSDEIAAAVRAVGWRDICLGDNPASTRARFVDAYRSSRGAAVREIQQGDAAIVGPGRQLAADLAKQLTEGGR